MLGNRYSQHSFAQIPSVNMVRSSFDRSFTLKDTMDFDYLIPVFIDEVIPGDTANVNVNCFGRLSTQKVPIMDNMYIDFFFFFVPCRLVWEHWEEFCGAIDYQDVIPPILPFSIPTVPTTAVTGEVVGSIADKFGIPTDVPGLSVNALPFRAYNLIWNDWFRDQNTQSEVTVPIDDGPDVMATDFQLLKRNKRHDYFTSCLPWPQKGVDVTLDMGTAPITGMGKYNQTFVPGAVSVYETGGIIAGYTSATAIDNGAANDRYLAQEDPDHPGYPGIYADLSNITGNTINSLRQALAIQSILELDARGGTRYTEILLNHYRVVSPDFRLQRPEYLGGGSTRINVHPVAQTSPTSGSNAQGQLAAFATTSAAGGNIGFTKSFVEHGYIIGLACARADITYQQGLNKLWSRSERYDFFWPKLQELGEQAVLNKEIYAQGTSDDDEVFGYQERYAEYRYKPSEIHGEFRSTYSTPLDMYHLAEEFGALPTLSSSFIEQTTPISRALTITSGPDLLMDYWFSYKNARPMMTYGVPSVLGRF